MRRFAVGAIIITSLLAACDAPTRPPTLPEPSADLIAAAGTNIAVTGLGGLVGQSVNDAGTIVGVNGSNGYLWNAGTGSVLVASGAVLWDVSQDNMTIGGRDAAHKVAVWTATSLKGPWSETVLPDLGYGGAVRSVASGTSGSAAILTGNVWGGTGNTLTPGLWTPCGTCSSGWQLQVLPLAAPVVEGWGQSVNPSGMVVGMEGSGCCRALFWDASANYAMSVLPPIASGAAAAAWDINDASTVIVGQSKSVAVAWVSATTAGFQTTTPVAIESPANCNGSSVAYSVTPDLGPTTPGVIVGQSCGYPVAWRVALSASGTSLTVLSRIALPSTIKPAKGIANGVNRTSSAHYGATGQAGGTGVFWTGF